MGSGRIKALECKMGDAEETKGKQEKLGHEPMFLL